MPHRGNKSERYEIFSDLYSIVSSRNHSDVSYWKQEGGQQTRGKVNDTMNTREILLSSVHE